MARKTDEQIAHQQHIADPADRFGVLCTQAYALSNKFHCHSCKPEAHAAHNPIEGYGVPRYRLHGLDSRQQPYDFTRDSMLDVLVAFAREMAVRYARQMEQAPVV